MLIDLSFDDRIFLAESVKFRKLKIQLELLDSSPEDFPDGMYDDMQRFLQRAPFLIDRLLADPLMEED